MNEYQERIICNKCKNETIRKSEIITISDRFFETNSYFNIIIIKKFKCKKCKEEQNYSVSLEKKNKKKKEII